MRDPTLTVECPDCDAPAGETCKPDCANDGAFKRVSEIEDLRRQLAEAKADLEEHEGFIRQCEQLGQRFHHIRIIESGVGNAPYCVQVLEHMTSEERDVFLMAEKLESTVEENRRLKLFFDRLRGSKMQADLATLHARYEALREALIDYGQHTEECDLSHCTAGRPTKDGGYEHQVRGEWIDSKKLMCTCGFDSALADAPEALRRRRDGVDDPEAAGPEGE